jgi:hypothetical protein
MSAKNQGAESIGADHYPTPPSVIRRYLAMLPRVASHRWIDLCAGEGHISRALIEAGVAPKNIIAIELRKECRPALEALGVCVRIGDALSPETRRDIKPVWPYSGYAVIGNPPFGLWDALQHAYRPFASLHLLGRAGMAAGAQARAAAWREDQPTRWELPERVSFCRVEYYSAETGLLLASGGQDAAGYCWFGWSGNQYATNVVRTLPDATEDGYVPPVRRIYVSGAVTRANVKAAAKTRTVREEMVPAVWPAL